MWKEIGVVLVLLSTSLEGIRRAADIRRGYEQMQSLRYIIALMKSEIRYGRASLEDVFDSVAEKCEDPYKSWFITMRQKIQKKSGERFVTIWQESVDSCLDKLKISKREKQNLKETGAKLGNMDLQMQIRSLELYEERLEEGIRRIQEQMETKIRLCYCLGVSSGLLTTILLL